MLCQRLLLTCCLLATVLACAAPPAAPSAPAAAPQAAKPSGAAPASSGAAAPSGAPPAASAPAPAITLPATPEVMEYGVTSITASYWVTFVTQARGYFEEERLIVNENVTGSAAAGTLAVVSGSMDIVGSNPDPITRSIVGGADLVIAAGTLNPAIYGLFARKDIRTVQELRGQTVMMGGPKDVTMYMFARLAAPHGLRPDDFDYVYAGGTPDRYRALQAGAVAATLLFQPFDFQAKRDGYPLLDTTYQTIKDLLFSTFVVSRGWLENETNRGKLVRWLTAQYRGAQALCDPANKDEMVRILAEKTRLSEEDSRASYDLMITDTRSVKCDLRATPDELQKVIDYIVEMGDISPPLPNPQRIVDMRYLDQAIARAR